MTALVSSTIYSPRLAASAGLTTFLLLSGCATTKPVDYQQLSSNSRLMPAAHGGNQFEYDNGTADLKSYDTVEIDPVAIYDGPDAQFGKVSTADREKIAAYMQDQFTKEVKTQVNVVTAPDVHTARIHLTLTGLEKSTPVLSTLTHVVPVGVVLNAGKQAAGHGGSFFGSVSYAIEIYDVRSGDLIYASISKRSAKALDVTSSIGVLDAAKNGVRAGAKELSTHLARADNARKVNT